MEAQKILIEKLFRSECNEKELIVLLDSMKNSGNDNYHEIMHKLWSELGDYPSLKNEHSDLIFEKTLAKIGSSPKKTSKTKVVHLNRIKRPLIKYFSIAATILVLGGGFAWNWFASSENITISTAFAETKSILLPDGSNVELNAGSQLTYNPNWCSTCDRQVTLKGEAFFEVAKKEHTGQKFKVLTSDLTVEVLGTAFNVNTLHDQTQVFLEEGKVKLDLKEETEEMLMEPGDVVTYSIQTKKREKQPFKKDESIVWRDGFTSMRNIPLSRILQKVEDIYGEKFKVLNNDHLKRKFTIGIPVDNFETTLTVLKEVTKLNISKKQNLYMVQ